MRFSTVILICWLSMLMGIAVTTHGEVVECRAVPFDAWKAFSLFLPVLAAAVVNELEAAK